MTSFWITGKPPTINRSSESEFINRVKLVPSTQVFLSNKEFTTTLSSKADRLNIAQKSIPVNTFLTIELNKKETFVS